MKVSVILPMYNERENIVPLVTSIAYVTQKAKMPVTMVIIDDNSPDGTGKIADKLAAKYPIHVIHRPGKLGLGSAYLAGFSFALQHHYDVAITMDADLSHNPEVIPDIVHGIKEGYDVVIGSRYIAGGGIENWGVIRRIISKGANLLAHFFLQLQPHDVTSGYRGYKKEVLQSINLNNITSNGYSFLQEILYRVSRKQFKIGEVPIVYTDRKAGKSKLGKKEMIKFLKTLLVLRFKKIDE